MKFPQVIRLFLHMTEQGRHISARDVSHLWNSLPENVVTANTIDCFKTRLDKFWNSQDVKFDYKQNLTGLPMIT